MNGISIKEIQMATDMDIFGGGMGSVQNQLGNSRGNTLSTQGSGMDVFGGGMANVQRQLASSGSYLPAFGDYAPSSYTHDTSGSSSSSPTASATSSAPIGGDISSLDKLLQFYQNQQSDNNILNASSAVNRGFSSGGGFGSLGSNIGSGAGMAMGGPAGGMVGSLIGGTAGSAIDMYLQYQANKEAENRANDQEREARKWQNLKMQSDRKAQRENDLLFNQQQDDRMEQKKMLRQRKAMAIRDALRQEDAKRAAKRGFNNPAPVGFMGAM